MKITYDKKTDNTKTDLTVLLSYENSGKLPSHFKTSDKMSGGVLADVIKAKDFKGETGELYPLRIENRRVLLVGLGKKANFNVKTWVKALAAVTEYIQKKEFSSLKIALDIDWPAKVNPEIAVTFLVKAVSLTEHKFDKYKSDKKDKAHRLEEVVMANLPAGKINRAQKLSDEMLVIAQAINFARDLGNTPSNEVTPPYFVKVAKELAKKIPRLSVKTFTVDEMKKLHMGGILGVGAGSQHVPQFIVLHYRGNPRQKENLVLVGKTVTFDSGGISIKPSKQMDEMKFDMSGGAAVIAAIKAIAELKLKMNVVSLIPAVENVPSGTSYKPGDVVKTMSGKTIEVLNTDAEGRVILADALSYAKTMNPKYVVDLATLTGACVVALGHHVAGVMGNDQPLINKVLKSSKVTNEEAWQLPLMPEYTEQIKSKVADVQNISNSPGGGTITAAAFLQEFVDNYKWAHLDIAGVAWTPKSNGATGYGVHLLVELAKTL